MLETFTLDTFRPRIGEDFQIAAGPQRVVTLSLTSVDDLSDRSAGTATARRRAPFSLLFHGPAENFLPQGTYPVRHDTIGEFPLFLVPLGPQQGQMRYEAIFT